MIQFEVGKIVEGNVTGITKFGAFVELAPGKVGLVHISEVAASYVSDIADYLQIGQTVSVKILALSEQGKINLSMKQVLSSPASQLRSTDDNKNTCHKNPVTGGGENYAKTKPRQFSNRASETPYHAKPSTPGSDSFESMLNKFMKNSDEKISQLKKSKDLGRRSATKRQK